MTQLQNPSATRSLFFACLVIVVGFLSVDLYNPSLPEMVKILHIDAATTKTLASTFLLGFGLSQLIYGPLSDQYGRKKIILFSVAVALLGNVLTIDAHNASQLLWYRFITGLGAGGCPVISRAIIRDSFADKKTLTRAFGVLAMSSQLSPGLAPMAGGLIEHFFGWQYNFVALSLISFIALLVLLFGYRETNLHRHEMRFSALLTNYGSLLRSGRFMLLSILAGVVFVYTMGYYTINPFVYQSAFQLSPAQNGFIFIFFAAGLVLGAYLLKPLTKRFRPETILLWGLLGLCLVSLLMCGINAIWSNMILLLTEEFFMAIFCGITAPALISLALLPFPEKAGAAGALQGTLKMLIGGLLLFWFAQYQVDTALELAYVMLAASGFVLILTLLLLKPLLKQDDEASA